MFKHYPVGVDWARGSDSHGSCEHAKWLLCTLPNILRDKNTKEYDPETGRLKWLNKFAEYHNDHLKKELRRILEQHPHTNIIYADYYNAAMCFYRSPSQYGN